MTIRRFVPVLLLLAAAGLCLALVFGFLGRLHMAFDSFAHLRIHLAVLLALIGIALSPWRGWRLAGAVAIVTGAAVVLVTAGPAKLTGAAAAATGNMPVSGARYRLLQINVRYDNPTPEKVLSLIGRTMPDVITLEEIPELWQRKLRLIGAAYPYRILCPPPSYIGGVAILSRRPFEAGEEPRCYDRGSLAIATVNFGGKPVSIAALHLGWPWPFSQPGQLLDIEPVLETKLRRTALLAGDFNAVPWSETVRRVAGAGSLKVVRGIGPTWLEQGLPDALRRSIGFPIDNILARGDILLGTPRRLDEVGSDHLPVLIEFGLKPQEEEAGVMQAELRE